MSDEAIEKVWSDVTLGIGRDIETADLLRHITPDLIHLVLASTGIASGIEIGLTLAGMDPWAAQELLSWIRTHIQHNDPEACESPVKTSRSLIEAVHSARNGRPN